MLARKAAQATTRQLAACRWGRFCLGKSTCSAQSEERVPQGQQRLPWGNNISSEVGKPEAARVAGRWGVAGQTAMSRHPGQSMAIGRAEERGGWGSVCWQQKLGHDYPWRSFPGHAGWQQAPGGGGCLGSCGASGGRLGRQGEARKQKQPQQGSPRRQPQGL